MGTALAGTLWETQRLRLPAAEWCSALATFVAQHGRRPKRGEPFQHGGRELRLGKWLEYRRAEERKGWLASRLKAAIEEAAGPQLAATTWEVWSQCLPTAVYCAALAAFMAQHGRLPEQGENFQHGGRELSLDGWLHHRQQEERKGELAPQLKAAIEEAAGPQLTGVLWPVQQQQHPPPAEHCAALAAFVAQHGRLPKQQEAFQHAGQELRLGKWLVSRRTEERKGKLDQQLKAEIEEAAGPQLAVGLWEKKVGFPANHCSSLAAFVRQRGRLPWQGETFDNGSRQLQLGRWLARQVREERKGKLDTQLKATLEAAAGPQLAGVL